ncbi:MAG: hypothetical protein FVQ77_09680 [Cytophagales bacterium]|nr:hypothetical protein [Cytophagales bacterium]
MKFTNGTIRINNINRDIYWWGLYATHVLEKFIKTNFKRANTMKQAKRLLKISGSKKKIKNNPEQNTSSNHNFYKENKAVREDFKRLNEIDAQYGIEQINVDELDEFEQKVLKKHNIILK